MDSSDSVVSPDVTAYQTAVNTINKQRGMFLGQPGSVPMGAVLLGHFILLAAVVIADEIANAAVRIVERSR